MILQLPMVKWTVAKYAAVYSRILSQGHQVKCTVYKSSLCAMISDCLESGIIGH